MPRMPPPENHLKPTAKKHPLRNRRAFQQQLIQWFETDGKSYPWRDTQDPWAILVSEIMLQQTQVSTVLGTGHKGKRNSEKGYGGGHYTRFMKLYPTPRAMANASEQEILKAWEGLGYYRRARNLHAAAHAISRDYDGHFPREFNDVLALPGIGPYTAGAVASFAYNDAQPIVDANVARVFSRLFNFQDRIDTTAGNKQLWQWATELVPEKNPRAYNSALMELGQTYCSNQPPDCKKCHVRQFCQCGDPSPLPIKKSATKVTRIDEHAVFSRDGHGRVLLQQKKTGERREGMWSLPRREHDDVLDLELILKTTYSITRYRVTLHTYASHADTTKPQANERWFSLDELEHLPMPSPYRKALESLIQELD